MIESEDITSRQAIPRWRSIRLSNESGERAGLGLTKGTVVRELLVVQSKSRLNADFKKKKAAWQASNDICDAEELVTTGVMSGNHTDPDVLTAAILLSTDVGTADGLQEFASRIVDGVDTKKHDVLPVHEARVREELSRRKRQLILNPRDGLRLAETALLYANIGQFHLSQQLLERALKTLPNDRYILRSAARFFTHIHRPDIAIDYLSKSNRSRIDPWLSSALLATSAVADRPIGNWKSAKNILKNGNFSDFDNSELAAQLGSLEIEGGSRTRSLKLLRQSAADPTENAIAQLEWVSRQTSAFETGEMIKDLSASHEASANAMFWNNDWAASLAACDKWHDLEPFSVRPAIFGTYVASISSQSLDHGIALANASLRANPGETTLWNNMAVMHAYKGDTRLARDALEKSIPGRIISRPTPVSLATSGLIEIRAGNIEQGVDLYLEAINLASQQRDPITSLRAYAFLAREVSRLDLGMKTIATIELEKAINKCRKLGIRVPREVTVLKDEIENMSSEENHLSTSALAGLSLADQLLN